MKKWIVAIILIAIALLGGVFIVFPAFKNQTLKNTNLVYCQYSVGGGMLGGFSSSTLEKKKDGTVQYVTKYAETHSDRIVTKTYTATEEDLQQVQDAIIQYNMYGASKKGQSPFIVMDGDTSHLQVRFDNGESFSVSSDQNLSTTEAEHFRAIKQLLSSFAKGEPLVEIEPHEIALILDGYQIGYILADSEATEALLEELGEYPFADYKECAIYTTLPKALPTQTLTKPTAIEPGDVCYNPSTNQLFFFYKACPTSDDLYQLGGMENRYDSGFELLRNLEPGNYTIHLRK